MKAIRKILFMQFVSLIVVCGFMCMLDISSENVEATGLGNTPWPMFHHDVKHTGLSPYDTSGNQGDLLWSFTTGGMVRSSPTIDSNGTIYVGSNDGQLYAINPDGTEKWNFTTGWPVFSSPAIGSDGTIYMGSCDNKLYAINPDGTQKWSFTTVGSPGWSSPAIGSDGTIYVGSDDNKLYAINPNGTQKWGFTAGDDLFSSPAIGSDGTIYVGSHDYKLYAINLDGTQKWSFTTDNIVCQAPAIGSDGTIYIGCWGTKYYAINPNGTEKWSFTTGCYANTSPAIGSDGTIYVGSSDKNFYAINPDGTQKWNFTTGDEIWCSSAAIGSDGTIYVGSDDDKLYAINPDGTQKWNLTTGYDIKSSPAIGSDGTIYVGSCDCKLYAIGALPNQPPVANTGGPYSGDEGNQIQLNGSGSYDPDGDSLLYYWDLDDDNYYDDSAEVSPKYTWGDDGMYTVKLAVYDGEYWDFDSTTVTINNVAPTINSVTAPGGDENSPITFTSTATDPGSDDLTFTWNWGDGTSDTVTTYYNNGVGPDPDLSPGGTYPFSVTDTVQHTYGDDGDYTITLTVSDDDGGSTQYTTTITINPVNDPPVADPNGPYSGDEGSQIQLDGSGSYDPDGDSLSYFWDLDDDNYYDDSIDVSPTYTWGDDGIYTVKLAVYDGEFWDFDSTTVTIGNVAPTISSSTAPGGDEGTAITYSSTATDPGSDDLTFTWNWGDGTTDTLTIYYNDGVGPEPIYDPNTNEIKSPGGTYPFSVTDMVQHIYGDNGDYIITFTVSDDDGGSTLYTTTVTINNAIPMIDSISAPGGDEGTTITYSSTATDQGSDDLIFTWNWGDGTSDTITTYYNNGVGPDPYPSPEGTYPFSATDTVQHTYGDNGDYTITLTISDDDGGSTPYTTTVTIDNVASTIDSISAPGGDEGTAIVYSSTATDQGSDDLTFIWNWGDGTSDTETTYYNNGVGPDPYPSPWGTYPFSSTDIVEHTYGDNGVYTVTLTVEDDDGGTTPYTTTVTVNNVAPTIDPFGPFTIDEGSPNTISATATDLGSDDLKFIWEFELGPTITNTYYNDGLGPDPYPSPWGTFPFSATDTVEHTYGDNGVYAVTLTVEDDDGGLTTYTTSITVNNVAPTVGIEAYMLVDFTLRVAGEKWHDVRLYIYADGEQIGYIEIIRVPGDPDDQSKTIYDVKCDVTKTITATVGYTPWDDPPNGQWQGDNPVWVTLTFEDGSETTLFHNFNVDHPGTYYWYIDVNQYLAGHEITFDATATDPGSDDLEFTWDLGDGLFSPIITNIYYNDGIGPDPPKSPWGTYPFTVTDVVKYTYSAGGDFIVTLGVADDDGSVTVTTITIKLS